MAALDFASGIIITVFRDNFCTQFLFIVRTFYNENLLK
nr:MAG TPA: hypothetical protein [Caudoviricetes sp.]